MSVKGFKAFNKNMQCRGFQFEEGQTYEHQGDISLCQSGFHFCENPFDVLDYYDLCDSEFAAVEAEGETKTEGSKTVTNKIKIGAKIGLKGFVKASFDFLWEKCKTDKELASGHSSQLAASGDSSKLAVDGKYSVGAGIGINNRIKAALGSWITLAEWKNESQRWVPICVKSAQIDGETLKADTWYVLKDGEFQGVAAQ
jgi:hypothetical protein